SADMRAQGDRIRLSHDVAGLVDDVARADGQAYIAVRAAVEGGEGTSVGSVSTRRQRWRRVALPVATLVPRTRRIPGAIRHVCVRPARQAGHTDRRGAQTLRVAIAGGTAAARRAGPNTATWPSSHSASAPTGR